MSSKRPSYSLVELLVVIAVISIIGIASIPNIFNHNDRLSLDSSANQLRQVIIDAQTRSKAPDKADSASSAQIYQVAVGKFPACQPPSQCGTARLVGVTSTNSISLERGLAQCDSGDQQGGFTTLRSLSLPRGIYVSDFYPTILATSDHQAVIRFTVGQEGFTCGSNSNPQIKSTQINSSIWIGANKGSSTAARYLVITLSSQRVAEKRFVTVDRATGEVAVARSNPQSYFTPVVDNLSPRWTDVDPNKFTLSVTCGQANSTVVMSFPRAQDRVNDPLSVGDPNLFITYDISWNTNGGAQPIVLNYFEDLSHSTVNYRFTTDRFTFANQPPSVIVTASAVDAMSQAQPTNDPDATLKQRSQVFTPACGSAPQGDPAGQADTCNPIISHGSEDKWWNRLTRTIFEPALAAIVNCPPEGVGNPQVP